MSDQPVAVRDAEAAARAEAAAATAVVVTMLSAFGGGPVKVTVDRPFLFAIIDTQTSLPLFLGRVVRPASPPPS